MRWAWLALLVGCAGSSPSSSSSSSSSSTSSSGDQHIAASDASEATPAEPARINLSAGPAAAEPALVPQRPHRDAIETIYVVRDRPLAITATASGGLISVIDVPTGHVRASRRFARGMITRLAASDDGSRVLIAGTRYYGSDNPQLGVWDLRDDSFTVLKEMERQLAGAEISPDGERVAFVTYEYEGSTQLHLVPSRGGEAVVREIPTANRLVFARDGSVVAVSTNDSVLLVDPQTGETRATIALENTRRFETANSWLAALGTRQTVVFDARGRTRARLNVASSNARFTPNGSELVLCVDDALVVRSGTDLSEARETEVECAERLPIDARHQPTAFSMRRNKLYIRRDTAEPTEVELDLDATPHFGFPDSPARRWFLVSGARELYIYNLRHQRLRRIVAEGASEASAWSVERIAGRLRLKRRNRHRDFPRAADPELEASAPTIPDGAELLSTPPDGGSTLVVLDPFGAQQPALLTGSDEPRRLSLPRSAVFACYDYEDGVGCGGNPVWGPGNQFVLPLEQGMLTYAANGRRVGHSTTARSAEYANDSTLLVEHADGSLTLSTLRFQRRSRVFNARQGGDVRTALDGNGRLAATRGRVLQIVDVASAEQRHRIELSAPATADPTFVEDQVQLRTRDGFFRWSLADGSETMRVVIDDIRALSTDESEALYCAEGRLRHRVVAEDAATDLMPCPQPGWMQFDGEFVYWVEGNAGHVLRRSDGQRLTLRTLGEHGFATTPQGHAFVTSDQVLGSLRFRGAGPIYDASLEEVSTERLTPTLIDEFLAGRPLPAR